MCYLERVESTITTHGHGLCTTSISYLGFTHLECQDFYYCYYHYYHYYYQYCYFIIIIIMIITIIMIIIIIIPPTSLTSCVCKTMERMINVRLLWFLESF